MRFIVTQTGYGVDNSPLLLEIAVNAQSIQEINNHLEEEAVLARNFGQSSFSAYGVTLLTHNFFNFVSPRTQAQWEQFYKQRQAPALGSGGIGKPYQYVGVKVETLDAWFSRKSHTQDADALLAA